MALISTLRKRMGKIVVGFVAFSMFAFILTDLLQSNSRLLGGPDNNVAEIAGKDISYEQFQNKVDELAYIFAVNQGRDPQSQDMVEIRTQAWNALIMDNAYGSQFEALGLMVTDAEQLDMVTGNNIDPQIKQFFRDPSTGEFSRENVMAFLSALKQGSAQPQQRASWISFENSLKPTRLITKYQNLVSKTNYVTSAEAKSKYVAQNSNMTVDYLYVPFINVADSLFDVSESEMKNYLSANADDYQKEESRSLSYVVVPVEPSAEDTAAVKEELASLLVGFATAENDSLFALRNTDGEVAYNTIADPGLLPAGLSEASIGTVTGLQLSGNSYAIHKLSDITEGDEAFVKASHILIEIRGTTDADKADAKKKAQDIIAKLKKGEDFAQLAAENSSDRSNANNGGDLGWFGENGNFVQPFKDAAFAHKGTGLIATPVETSFGYHIIRIDEPKTKTVYKVATIEKEIYSSEATINEAYRKADLLSSNSSDAQSLAANAAEAGLQVKTASNIGKNDSRVGVLTDARNIVLWLYNNASVDKVSDVKEFDDKYVVAVMTARQMDGVAQLDLVRNEVKNKVLNQKKAAYISEKIKALTAEDMPGRKAEYGVEAKNGTANITLSSNSFSGVGFAPEAVGVAFSLEEGETTRPFAVDNGVLMLTATAKSMAEDKDNYDSYKTQIANERNGRRTVIANFPVTFSPVMLSQGIDNAVKEAADIEDNRYKFF